MKALTFSQRALLREIAAQGTLTETQIRGRQHSLRTLDALAARGLVGVGGARWALTDAGQAAHAALRPEGT